MKPGEITIKDTYVLKGLLQNSFHPRLQEIILSTADRFGLTMTESYRPKKHLHDLHGTVPVRAIDIRSWCYAYPEAVADWINDVWVYDADRPDMKCALLHDAGQGIHFHIQVHPLTRRR
jgi:hypothetical protein